MESGSESLWTLYFLTRSADVNSMDAISGKTPLELATESGYGEVVKVLLKPNRVDVNTHDPISGKTPLCLAAENGHEDVVELLLVMGEADIGISDAEGMTALQLAHNNGHDAIVDKLRGREARKLGLVFWLVGEASIRPSV